MTTAAIYARFSTDRQTDSIDAQVQDCRAFAARRGLEVVEVFEDRAVSGASLAREGFQNLMKAARAHRFQAVIIKDVSRLSRDLGAMWRTVFDELPFLGVAVVDASTGMSSDAPGARTVFGAMGMASDSYLDFVRTKTHDGLRHRAADGFWTGGSIYGFRAVAAGEKKRLEVDDDRAAVVREVFERRARGETCRALADDLNKRGVEPPRTGSKKWAGWGASTVRAMLLNDAYRGVFRWNTRKWVKHPSTGKRVAIPRPEGEHVVTTREDLRIVDEVTWARVAEKFAHPKPGRRVGATGKGLPPNPLVGLARCGCCGGPMVLSGARRKGDRVYRQLRCSVFMNRGSEVCPNRRTLAVNKLVEGVMGDVMFTAFSPENADKLAEETIDFVRKLRAARTDNDAALRRQRDVVQRLVDAIATIGADAALSARYKTEKDRLAELEAEAATTARPLPTVEQVKARVAQMLVRPETMNDDITRRVLQDHVAEIRCIPQQGEGWRILVAFRPLDLPVAVSSSSGGRI